MNYIENVYNKKLFCIIYTREIQNVINDMYSRVDTKITRKYIFDKIVKMGKNRVHKRIQFEKTVSNDNNKIISEDDNALLYKDKIVMALQ